ncbi:MAG: ABC transporter ATP-binding protein [Clostridia bacterium]|nr:ABC transporter ATP-binding protein [Clostridia bacterium]
MLKRFLRYYRPHKTLFFWDMVAAFFIAVLDCFYPVITRAILNDHIPNKNMKLIIVYGVALFLVYTVKLFLLYFVNYYGHLVGVRMQADMRRDMFNHLQKLPFSYYDDHATGVLLSRMVNDLMEISELAHHGPEDLLLSLVLLIGSFFYLLSINWQLTLIIFAFIPVLVWFSAKMRKRMHDAFLETRKRVGEINATAENSITGIRVSKAFDMEKSESAKFENGNARFVVARKHAYKAMGQFSAGTVYIISLLNFAVLLGGGLFTYYEVITLTDFFTFMLFVNLFVTPIRSLVGFIEQYQNGMTGFKRFTEILDEPIETESPTAKDITVEKGKIELRNINFAYEKGGEVLKNVNLTVEAGKTLALVGASGGGKSTICHLLPRFYTQHSGEILIDVIPTDEFTFSSLRRTIGIVQQDVFLFDGTIRDNIMCGNPEATETELAEAVRRARLTDFVNGLENGLDTEVGERGVKLSGGQKQRISIARVFLKNPKILVLDEATSALDNATEFLIQESLNELCAGRTTIVVAHRLSTIRHADSIAVIDEGEVKEYGTHDELLNIENGAYKTLYEASSKLS